MKQYEFRVINKKTGKADSICATASNRLAGWLAVNNYYGTNYKVHINPIAVRAPHTIYGEIDCTI